MKPIAEMRKAIEIASDRHNGQVDKGGQRYFDHVLRVASRCGFPAPTDEAIVGLLHDVVEDGLATFEELLGGGFRQEIVDAVRALTRCLPYEPWEHYIDGVERNRIALLVKIADLEDNMDIRRLPKPLTNSDLQRLVKYHTTWLRLRESADAMQLPLWGVP